MIAESRGRVERGKMSERFFLFVGRASSWSVGLLLLFLLDKLERRGLYFFFLLVFVGFVLFIISLCSLCSSGYATAHHSEGFSLSVCLRRLVALGLAGWLAGVIDSRRPKECRNT